MINPEKTMTDWSAKTLDGWVKVDDPTDTTAEDKQLKEFQELCKPVAEWLQKNYQQRIRIEIEPDRATLYVGQMGTAYEWKD